MERRKEPCSRVLQSRSEFIYLADFDLNLSDYVEFNGEKCALSIIQHYFYFGNCVTDSQCRHFRVITCDMSSPSVLETVFSESSGLENLFTKLKSYLQPPDNQGFAFRYADSSPAGHNPNVAGRQELIAKLVSTCLGLAVSFTITYFGFRYLANVLDPTRQEKKEAQKRVSFIPTRVFVHAIDRVGARQKQR